MSQNRQVVFQHMVLKGEPYQIGQTLAQVVRAVPGFTDFVRSGAGSFSAEQFDQVTQLLARFCPGVSEEIRGLADGLETSQRDIIYYAHSCLFKGNCSHFALLPSMTADQHVLVGRSYEFGDKADDLRLCTMQAKGKYAFIGSSTLLFGFNEGMNEHGVTVTASVGGIPVGKLEGLCPPIQDGLQFWVVVRAVLEQCQTVDQAIQLIEAIPTSGNPILIVADKTGQAALVEVYGPHKAVKRIDARSGEQFLCATNHFTLPAMLPYTKPGVMAHSQVRYETIRAHLTEKQPVGRESIKSLLAAKYPAGLCCHYYDELFGTLRSMIFDPTAGELEVCFGSPSANAWHRVSFSTPMNRYVAQLPIESTSPDFWRLVSDESSH